MKISSAEFTKLTIQEVADMILDNDCDGVSCFGLVEGQKYKLNVSLEVIDDV